jgi:hypothetical protein
MALPQVQSYRAGVANAPSAATPRVSFGQPTRADLAVQAEAQYQNTMGQVLDRISSRLFKVAETQSAREGLQFAIDNPMTSEQLQAMSRGEMPADLDLGNPLNVFNNAVRKARAIEVSAHFEMEDTQKLLEISDAADRGMISTEDAKNKITAIINASSSVQANIDPDASYKYRATMANYGSRVVDYIAKKEIEKTKVANTFKVQQSYQNTLGIMAKAMEAPLGINPATNAEWEIGDYLNASIQNFIGNTQAVLGQTEAAKYGAKMKSDMENIMIGAVRKELIKPQYFQNPVATLDQIATGNVENVRQIGGYFAVNNPDALIKLQSEFRTMISDRRMMEDETRARDERDREIANRDDMVEYFTPGTSGRRKNEIAMQVARRGGFSISQMEQFLDPTKKAGDPYLFGDIKTRIVNGDITTPDQLKRETMRAGMNGEQYNQLNNELLQGFSRERAEAQRRRKQAAGVPDTSSVFGSKDNAHQIEKDRVLDAKMQRLADEFRAKPENQGKLVPWLDLTDQAIKDYDINEKADAEKQQAIKKLQSFADELKTNKLVNADFEITADTNIEDLIARGILKKDEDIAYVRKQINILRRVGKP